MVTRGGLYMGGVGPVLSKFAPFRLAAFIPRLANISNASIPAQHSGATVRVCVWRDADVTNSRSRMLIHRSTSANLQ